MSLHIPPSRTASCLGLAALIPFIVLSACLWFVAPVWQADFARALSAYGALILAALGAIHWGAAIKGPPSPDSLWRYIYGLMPVLLAWVVVLSPPQYGFFLLFLGFGAAYAIDRRVWAHLEWYVILRAVLTVLTGASLFAAYKALTS
jgi:hypothetical protein